MAQFPSTSSAYGVWSLKEQRDAARGDNWPLTSVPVDVNASGLVGTSALGSVTVDTPAPLPSLPADAVLYISGEGGISDTSTNGYTVTNAGGASHETSVVKVGTGAVAFDGTNTAYIYVSGQTFIDDGLSSWQFQCWARNSGTIPGTGDTGQLVDQYQASQAGRMIFGFQSSGIDLRVNGGSIYLTSGDILSGDTWYHVCLNYDGTTHRLFIDGDLKDSSTTVPTIYTGVDTGFGGGGSLSGYDLNGYMDDILVQQGGTVFTSNFTPNTTGYST